MQQLIRSSLLAYKIFYLKMNDTPNIPKIENGLFQLILMGMSTLIAYLG